jgi:tetratricopeptide (TPR) repeat protein
VQALAASGDREAARKMAVKAHQFAGVHGVAPPPGAWQTLAVLELLAGRTAEALTAMHRGMGGAPSAAAINNLAVILETRGDAGEARRAYRQALDAAPPPADRTVIERNLARLEKSP